MADWTELPIDILGILVQHFELVEDYHRFRAVCKSWRSLTRTEEKSKFSLKFPSLVIESIHEPKKDCLMFSSLLTSHVFEINVPEAARKRCIGVYPGWIFTVRLDNFQIDLLNPFTGRVFNLPSTLHFKDQYEECEPMFVVVWFVSKVVASTSPEEDDCIILAIYGKLDVLAFARIGDRVWTNISCPSARGFDDVVHYKGQFYAVDRHGVVFVCDLDHKDGPAATIAAETPLADPRPPYFYQQYLVESRGNLYLLFRERERYCPKNMRLRRYFTTGFYVFRLVRDENHHEYPYCLEGVDNLGDRAFFIGPNPSTSTSSSDCVRANSIYFCDDNLVLYQLSFGAHDIGIFDMETRKIEYHNVSYHWIPQALNPPFWFFDKTVVL